jgi:putative phage-type endonuclease
MIASGATVLETDRLEWLETRKSGLGGSDAPSVLGVSPWKSPLELYLEKTGQAGPVEETEPMRIGKLLEPVLASEYRRRNGCEIHEQVFLKHRLYPELFATLDAIRPDGWIAEFKAVGLRSAGDWGDEGSEDLPLHYLTQVHHQIAVADAPGAHVLALIGGQEFRQYEIPRRESTLTGLVQLERDFWSDVLERNPPLDLKPGDHRLWHRLYPEEAGGIPLSEEDASLVARWQDAATRKNVAAQQEAALKTEVLAALGPFGSGLLPDGRELRRKAITVGPKTYTTNGYTYTDLRVRKAKAHD